jgi:hypothetical protein
VLHQLCDDIISRVRAGQDGKGNIHTITAEEGLALTLSGRAFQTSGARMVLRAR